MKKRTVSEAPANNIFWVIKLIFLCIAAQFFLAGFALAVWNFYQILTFSNTTGVVSSISMTQTTGKTAAVIYDYRVNFQTPKGKINAGAGKTVFYRPYSQGETVTVYYDPQNPQTAFINTFPTIWFIPTVIFLVGLIPLFISSPEISDFRIIYQKLFR